MAMDNRMLFVAPVLAAAGPAGRQLKPGRHSIAFEFDGRGQGTTVGGKARDVRYVRIDGMVWSWKSTFEWASEPEAATLERALKARLVADVAAR